jgi:hypothetical protein
MPVRNIVDIEEARELRLFVDVAAQLSRQGVAIGLAVAKEHLRCYSVPMTVTLTVLALAPRMVRIFLR